MPQPVNVPRSTTTSAVRSASRTAPDPVRGSPPVGIAAIELTRDPLRLAASEASE